ncbi:uncharacterized protein LOC110712511 [Chenopodium quinoa]|uniref:uncharacterized protein LOC110712511 n=1 Tax=Chenopodium quinoa TaxID=63459 RepID=UPI000B781F46|nr:uncharacterized protein LOC110712511 [Chenopodium quinoa]
MVLDSSWWRHFWASPLLPKWKMFAWKIIHNALPSALLLARKGLPVESKCGFCHQEVETLSHLFRDCPFTWSLWEGQPCGSTLNISQDQSFEEWFPEVLSKFIHDKDWLMLDHFFSLLWALWLTRNSLRFRSTVYSPESILELASSWVDRCSEARSFRYDITLEFPPGFSGTMSSAVLRGNASDACTVSLTFDGAWSSDSHNAGTGWVFLDLVSDGHLGGGAQACSSNSVFQSELMACLFSLRHARQRGYSSLQILTDCSLVVDLLRSQVPKDIFVRWIQQELLELIGALVVCHVQKVPRSTVAQAHCLAGMTRRRNLLCFRF